MHRVCHRCVQQTDVRHFYFYFNQPTTIVTTVATVATVTTVTTTGTLPINALTTGTLTTDTLTTVTLTTDTLTIFTIIDAGAACKNNGNGGIRTTISGVQHAQGRRRF